MPMGGTRSASNDGGENNAFGDRRHGEQHHRAPVTQPSATTRSVNFVDGSFNVAIGDEAGTGLGASVNNCIAIGAPGAGPFATLDNTCFIGSIFGQPVSDPGTQVPVFVDQFNVWASSTLVPALQTRHSTDGQGQ